MQFRGPLPQGETRTRLILRQFEESLSVETFDAAKIWIELTKSKALKNKKALGFPRASQTKLLIQLT
jgi:hypothetical protein